MPAKRGVTRLGDVRCRKCRVRFFVPEELLAQRHRSGQIIWCPNGHPVTVEEPESSRLERELDQTRFLLQDTEDALYIFHKLLQQTEAKLRRMERRLAAGVCPACTRAFMEMERHMQTQHPGFGKPAPAGPGAQDGLS